MKLIGWTVRKPPRGALLCLPLLFFVSTAGTIGQTQDYIIGKGDQLLVTVWGYSEFTGPTTVKDDGLVTIPLVGEVQAAGLTKEAFIANLRRRLGEYVQGDIRITVSVIGSVGQRVTILGSVTRPDNYPVAKEMTLLELISMAGGYLPDANLTRVRIFHKDKAQLTTDVNVESYMERADIEGMPKVVAGDVVFVPRHQNFIKEFGEFFRDVILFFALFQLADGTTR